MWADILTAGVIPAYQVQSTEIIIAHPALIKPALLQTA